MIDPETVEQQLKDIGIPRMPMCRAELNQLPSIMVPGEVIEHLMAGIYLGGYAIMVATNRRLLVIDKKVGGIVIEDVPYDMIAEVEYVHTPFKSETIIFARSKKVKFRAFRGTHVREFTEYLQQRMMEVRQRIRSMQNPQIGAYQQGAYHDEQPSNYQSQGTPEPGLYIP